MLIKVAGEVTQSARRIAADLEQTPRLVDGLGTADDDERARRGLMCLSVGNQPVGALGASLHA